MSQNRLNYSTEAINALPSEEELDDAPLSPEMEAAISSQVASAPPKKPYMELTMREMRDLFEAPVADRFVISMKGKGGSSVRYLHWAIASRLAAYFAPQISINMQKEIITEQGILIKCQISIECSDGVIVVSEYGFKEWVSANGKPTGFGGAPLIASRQAMKRALALIGLGRGLYLNK